MVVGATVGATDDGADVGGAVVVGDAEVGLVEGAWCLAFGLVGVLVVGLTMVGVALWVVG